VTTGVEVGSIGNGSSVPRRKRRRIDTVPTEPERRRAVEIQVLVEPVNNGYRASALTLSVEATIPQEAVGRLQELFVQRLAAGASLATI
jgi:hypothetical protein